MPSDAWRSTVDVLRRRTPAERQAYVAGVEAGATLALQRIRRGASVDSVEAESATLVALLRDIEEFARGLEESDS